MGGAGLRTRPFAGSVATSAPKGAKSLAEKSRETRPFVITGQVPVIQAPPNLVRLRYLDARGKPGHDKIEPLLATAFFRAGFEDQHIERS